MSHVCPMCADKQRREAKRLMRNGTNNAASRRALALIPWFRFHEQLARHLQDKHGWVPRGTWSKR